MDIIELIKEARTAQQRMKAKQAMRKNKSKIKRGREKAARRMADSDTLEKRAKNAARRAIAKKLSGGKSTSDMSYSARASISKKLKTKKGQIDTLAKKLRPELKKKERRRFANRNKKESFQGGSLVETAKFILSGYEES